MIGEESLLPVSIFILRVYEGDGHFISGDYVHSIYASPDAVLAARSKGKLGPSAAEKWALLDGRYTFVEEVTTTPDDS